MATAGTGRDGSFGAGQDGSFGAGQNGSIGARRDTTFGAFGARPGLWRWLVPVGAAGLVVGGSVVSNAVADAPPSLPSRTPAQVLSLAAGTQVRAFSGTVTTHAALGLPDLSALQQLAGGKAGAGGSASSSVTDLTGLATRFVTGDTTLRVWHASAGDRVQLIDTLGEVDLVRNGTEVWAYSSADRVAAHARAADVADKQSGTGAPSTGLPTPPTPQALADQALKALDPTTVVTLDAPSRVADRAAYRLVLTPRSAGTLVAHVDLDVDAATGAALQVAVYGRGGTAPAIKVGFSSVDLTAPAASIFVFTPPAGVKVTDLAAGLPKAGTRTARPGMTTKPVTAPHVVGAGWDAVVVADARLVGGTDGAALSGVLGGALSGATAGRLAGGGTDPAAVIQGLTTAVPGGRGVQTALASVLLTDDGRVLAGAVPLSALSQVAAADLAAK